MGAFGPGSFENDAALELVAALDRTGDPAILDAALCAVADAGSDTPAAPQCAAAIAAAEVVAALVGAAAPSLPDTIAAWAQRRPVPSPALVERARRAIERVRTASALRDQWAAREDDGRWGGAVAELEGRLARAEAGVAAKCAAAATADTVRRVVGGLVGAALGWLAFRVLLARGIDVAIVVAAGLALGVSFGATTRRIGWGVGVAVAGTVLTVVIEWWYFPFRTDPSLGQYLTHLHDLPGKTIASIVSAALVGVWFGQGRRQGGGRPR